MTYKRPIALDVISWFHGLLLFACLYPFAASLLSYSAEKFWRMSASALLLLIPVILSFVLVPVIRNLILYLAAGIGIAAFAGVPAYFLAGACSTAFTVVIGIAVFGVHAYSRVRYGHLKQEFMEAYGGKREFSLQEREMGNFLEKPDIWHLLWFTIIYVLGMFLKYTTCLYIIFAMVFVDVFLIIGYNYIDSLYRYMREKQKVANLPVQTMQRMHRISGIAGALLLALFLLPSLLYGREIQPSLQRDTPLIHIEEETEEKEESYAEPAAASMPELITEAEPAKEPPQWLTKLANALVYLLTAAVLVILLISIFRHVRRLGKDFAVEQEDEAVFLDSCDDEEKRAGIFGRGERESRLSANQKIRRRYRKTIRRATKGRPSRWASPAELEREASLADDAQMQTLHHYYEKARYSEEGCTQEEWREIHS